VETMGPGANPNRGKPEKIGPALFRLNLARWHMKTSCVLAAVFVSASVNHCARAQASPGEPQKITVATAEPKSSTITERYACRVESLRNIEVRAPDEGYVQEIVVKEGQSVKKGDVLIRLTSVLRHARLDAERADVQVAQLEYENAKDLFEKKSVSEREVQLHAAKLAKAKAKADAARAELELGTVRAPFDGSVGRMQRQSGTFVLKGEALTTLSDNSTMRAYFKVPETRYLEYVASAGREKGDPRIELVLANGEHYQHAGKLDGIDGVFDDETGTIAFRADFPNPDGLLRQGQSGTVSLGTTLKDAIVIPQRSTIEAANSRCVYVVGEDGVAHLREIVVQAELDDQFVLKSGLIAGEKFVLDGVRGATDGGKVEE